MKTDKKTGVLFLHFIIVSLAVSFANENEKLTAVEILVSRKTITVVSCLK